MKREISGITSRHSQTSQNIRGFTLIEVVVVMAIIAVLAALVVGAINVARNTAKETTHRSNARTLEAGMQAYYARHRTGPPANYIDGYIDSYSFTQLANVLDVHLTPTECDTTTKTGGGSVWICDLSYGAYAGYYVIVPYMANCPSHPPNELQGDNQIHGNMPYPASSP